MKKECPKLRMIKNQVTSFKRAGSAAMRVIETQRSASGEDAGKADTKYDVRTKIKDRLLQLSSGKRVPAMIDCGACGGKGSARELNLAIVKGLAGDTTVGVLMDTVRKGRVPKAPMENNPVVDIPFKHVAVDLIGHIEPASEAGQRYILTLVDYATRYPEAVLLKRINTETVAEALVDIYRRLGVPEEILSYQEQISSQTS